MTITAKRFDQSYRLIKREEESNVVKYEEKVVELNSTKGEKVDVEEILYRVLEN